MAVAVFLYCYEKEMVFLAFVYDVHFACRHHWRTGGMD